jgi:OOP family OmpA-OmpF porin
LGKLPRSKLSIAADRVAVSAISDSIDAQRKLETDLTRNAPEDLRVALDIHAPRPALTPFSLRFLIDDKGAARFDSCSADTDEARDAILAAALAAGLKGNPTCTLGLGAPSPRWGEAAEAAIKAVAEIGAGSVTFADADVSLVAPSSVPKDKFDAAVGRLERALPDAFSLHPVLTPPPQTEGSDASDGPPQFSASIGAGGVFEMQGRIGDERDRAVIGGFARALFGAGKITDATRLDKSTPTSWAVRVMAGLDALKRVEEGKVLVQPDFVRIEGRTGLPDAPTEVAKLFSEKLGEGARFEIDVTYDEKLDPKLGLPTGEECVAQINDALKAKQITFDPGSAEIDKDSQATVDKIASLMKNCADFTMEIGGHTDSQGREEMNQELSQQRAEAVIEGLVKRRVLTGNLTARGYGETQPIADNGTEAGREANRRIEFRLVKPEEEKAAGAADDIKALAADDKAPADGQNAADPDPGNADSGGDEPPMDGGEDGPPMDDTGGANN